MTEAIVGADHTDRAQLRLRVLSTDPEEDRALLQRGAQHLQDPGATQILLTAEYGPDAVSPAIGTLYPADTSLQADGRTRVLGYTKPVGRGGVTYIALGHCHNPAIRAARAFTDPADTTPPIFRVPWETDAFVTLLRNAIAWGTGAREADSK